MVDKNENHPPFSSPTQHTHGTLINFITVNTVLLCHVCSQDLSSHGPVSRLLLTPGFIIGEAGPCPWKDKSCLGQRHRQVEQPGAEVTGLKNRGAVMGGPRDVESFTWNVGVPPLAQGIWHMSTLDLSGV